MSESIPLNFYKICEEFFINELGFNPIRKRPDNIIVNNNIKSKTNLKFWKWEQLKGENSNNLALIIEGYSGTIIEAIIAFETLLSFLDEKLRNLALLKAFTYYRLINGKSPLKNSAINQLKKFYNQNKKQLEQEIAKDPLLHSDFVTISENTWNWRPDIILKYYYTKS